MFHLMMVHLAALLVASGAAYAQSPLERGEYLVNAVMACDGCHTPRPGGNFDMSKRFSGGSQIWDEKEFWVKGSNITGDRETGIGDWSDAEFKRLMVEGVRPSGVKAAPQMPFAFYKVLTARDLDAITAYTRSVAPVRSAVPPPVYKAPMHYEDIPGGEKPFSEEMMSDPLKRGFYLATIAHCMECHSRRPDGSPGYRDSWGRGGHVMGSTFGAGVPVSNITSHPVKGIGAWSDAEIKRALTLGVGRDGRTFKTPMARQIYYSKLTDADLNALVAWVRTIPPLE